MTLPTVGNDYDLDAGLAGLALRQELNAILQAMLSLNANAALPPQTFPFMLRADTGASPNELQVRNPADGAFLKLAEVTDTEITLFSDGAAVPSLGTPQTFTQAQTVDQQGSSGLLSIGSDLSAGVVARIPMFGHNNLGANTTGINLVCRINTNTSGAESFTFEVEAVRAGSTVTIATLGSLSDFRRAGGGGIVDADVLRQAGITLATIIDDEKGRLGIGGNFNFSSARTLAQADQGKLLRFNGGANTTITVPALAQNTMIFIVNDGSGDLSFVSAVAPNAVSFRTTRLTLPTIGGQSPMCGLVFFLSDGSNVNIHGGNVV